MNSVNTATDEKMPPTRKFAACWNRPSAKPADNRAAVVAEPAQRHRHEAVEIQQRTVGKEGEQQLPAGNPAMPPTTPASA